nr:MAG TPA: hypothetical protein [Caudoviricetes sp.]
MRRCEMRKFVLELNQVTSEHQYKNNITKNL